MEFVTVRYAHQRIVNIDGQEAGVTNRTLRINRGPHTFNLGDPRDYRPKWRRVSVVDTTSITPMVLVFEEC